MASKPSAPQVGSNRVVPQSDAPEACSTIADANGNDTNATNGLQGPTADPNVVSAVNGSPTLENRLPGPVRSRSKGGSGRGPTPQKVFDSVRSAPDPPAEAEGPTAPSGIHNRRWKVLGKLAMLARTAEPVIDIYHETISNKGKSTFMVHPNSKVRRVWEVMTACCVLYVVTMVPLIIGFNYVDWTGLSPLNTFIDWYFICGAYMR